METKHYDAFISYRHCELDKFVAVALHKKLEAFKIPKGVKSPTGKTRISRVFRDQDELPLSSNLSDAINVALENSDFLVVICTPRLKESEWCKREIETFIKLRGRDKILAVLAEGEPEESFPEILTTETTTYTDADGNVKTQVKRFEPLAADVRGSSHSQIKKKLHDAVLHIAAAIFNLNYDDLKQRHKERKMRQTLAIVSGVASAMFLFSAVCLGLLFKIMSQSEMILDQNNEIIAQNSEIKTQSAQIEAQNEKIKEQYFQAQKNYAISTADNADELLAYGRKMDAIYALRSVLPSTESDTSIPYTSEAHCSLFNAMQIYSEGESFNTENIFECENNITSMQISKDEKYLLATDSASNIKVWDIVSGNLVFTTVFYKPSYMVSEIVTGFVTNDVIYYSSAGGVILHNLTDNTDCYLRDLENLPQNFGYIDSCGSDEYFLYEDSYRETKFTLYKKDTFEPIWTVSQDDMLADYGTDGILSDFSISSDNAHLLVPVYPLWNTHGDMVVLDYDTATGELNQKYTISTMAPGMLAGFSMLITDTLAWNDSYYIAYANDENQSYVCCFDIASGKKKWETKTNSTPTDMVMNFDASKLYCHSSTLFSVLDSSDGSLLKIMSSSKMVDIKPFADAEGAHLMDTDGYVYHYGFQDELLTSPFLTEEYPGTNFLSQGYYFTDARRAIYLPRNSNYIIYYANNGIDESLVSDKVIYYSSLNANGDYYISDDFNVKSSADASLVYGTNEAFYTYASFIGDGSQYIALEKSNTLQIIDFINKTESSFDCFLEAPFSCDQNYALLNDYEGTYTVVSLPDFKETSKFTFDKDNSSFDYLYLINSNTIFTAKYGEPFKIYRAGQEEPIYVSERVMTSKEVVEPARYKDMFVVLYKDGFLEGYEVNDSVRLINTCYNIEFSSIDTPVYIASRDCYIIPGLPKTIVFNKDFEPILKMYDKWGYLAYENNFIKYKYSFSENEYQQHIPFYTYDELIKMADFKLGDYRPSSRIAKQYNITVK